MPMDKAPLISVIVPVYNVEEYLRPCLDSVLGQSYTHLEVICVNDGSTDGSLSILNEYAAKDARIKVITQANAGLSAARNTALEHCRGDFVSGIDSDDWWDLHILEKAVAHLDDEVDMLCFGMTPVWEGPCDEENDRVLREYLTLPVSGKLPATHPALLHISVCFCAKLWRRSVIEQYGMRFARGIRYEDSGFYALCMPACRAAYILPEIGYFYRQRAASIMGSTRENPKQQLEYVDELMYVAEQYSLHGRWKKDNGYFASLMCKALYHICTHGEERWEEYRQLIFRLVTEHKLLSSMPLLCVALLFSPFHPSASVFSSPDKWRKYAYIPHYIAGVIRYSYAAYIRGTRSGEARKG